MATTDPLYTIILAGGKGRDAQPGPAQGCFEIAGVPAIVRAIDAYNLLGVVLNVVVVGEMAGQVVETVGRRFCNVVFAYQPEAPAPATRRGAASRRWRQWTTAPASWWWPATRSSTASTLSRLARPLRPDAASDLALLVSPAGIARRRRGPGAVPARRQPARASSRRRTSASAPAAAELRQAARRGRTRRPPGRRSRRSSTRHLGPGVVGDGPGVPGAGPGEAEVRERCRRDDWLARLRDAAPRFPARPRTASPSRRPTRPARASSTSRSTSCGRGPSATAWTT